MILLLLTAGLGLQDPGAGKEPAEAAKPLSDRLSDGWQIDLRGVWTAFDNDLRIEDDLGVGLEIGVFSVNHGGPIVFRLGAYAWDTENEDDEAKEADVRVRQFLVGLGAGFEEEFIDLSFRLDLGAFTYSGGGGRDAGFMTQLGLGFGVIPHKHVKLEILPVLALTHAEFNRGDAHALVHFSASLGLSIRF